MKISCASCCSTVLFLSLASACAPADGDAGEGEGEELPPCRTIDGNATVETASDLEGMNDVCDIEGNLTFRDGVAAVSLPRLRRIDGGLSGSDNASLQTVSLPSLVTVGPTFFENVPALTSIEMPTLERVVVVSELDVLGDSFVQNCPAPTTLTLSSLEQVAGGLVIAAPELTSLSAPRLQETGDQLLIQNSARLESITLDALVSAGFRLVVFANASLTTLSMAALTSAGSITIGNNPELRECNGALLQGVGDCG